MLDASVGGGVLEIGVNHTLPRWECVKKSSLG